MYFSTLFDRRIHVTGRQSDSLQYLVNSCMNIGSQYGGVYAASMRRQIKRRDSVNKESDTASTPRQYRRKQSVNTASIDFL